jgi:hypothetical protein
MGIVYEGWDSTISRLLSMSLQFHRAVEYLDVWSASSADISFVITFASPNGPGFHGRHGFLASWRPVYSRMRAVKVTGSPFNTFAEAEAACNVMLGVLEQASRGETRTALSSLRWLLGGRRFG